MQVTRTIGCVLAITAITAIARADWVPFSELPGGARGEEIASEFANQRAATIRDIRWDPSGTTAWFRKDGAWCTVDLTTGAIAAAPDKNAPAAAAPRRSQRRGGGVGPARGRQQTTAASVDGTMLAQSRGGNLYLKCDGKSERAVTTDGTETLRYGTASWVYGEELDQSTAMWWSPTGEQLAFYRFDDSQVPLYTILSGLTRLRPSVETERYPKPGDPNPTAGLCVLDVKGFCAADAAADSVADPSKFIRSIAVGTADQYIYGVEYSPNGDQLLFHRLNRRHDVLELCSAEAVTGAIRVIVREEQPCWNHHRPQMEYLADGRRFIWSTEKSGFRQYELRSLDTEAVIALTSGDYPVGKIVEVHEEAGLLFYTAFPAETPINPQLMSVKLDGTAQRRLTAHDRHYGQFRIATNAQFFVASDETIADPPSTRLYRMSGGIVATLAQAPIDAWSSRKLPPPQLVRVKAADGTTDLFGTLHFPSQFDPTRSWPVIVDVYGGPYFSSVSNQFSAPKRACELGFVILQIDNRGTSGRGKAFEDATYMKLGGPDMDDQAAAVRQLATRPGIDGSRVGITGMSYGGYLAALALVRYPDVFKASVARAAPMDWRQYDTIYTERFMRTPAENQEGYDAGSVLLHADKMQGELLLIHGMQDDNVHPSNGWALAQKLYDREFAFDMLFFPKAAHGGFGAPEDDAMWTFFTRELKASPEGASRQ